MMKCEGVFIFKGIKHQDGGKFVNQQGQEISYDDSYKVKFDEISEDNECTERTVKVTKTQTALIEKLKKIDIYKKVIFIFEVGFNSRGITLKLIDVQIPQKTSA